MTIEFMGFKVCRVYRVYKVPGLKNVGFIGFRGCRVYRV